MNFKETLLYQYFSKFKQLTREERRNLYLNLIKYGKAKEEEAERKTESGYLPTSLSEGENKMGT